MSRPLSTLPSVSQLLKCAAISQLEQRFPAVIVKQWVRQTLNMRRQQLIDLQSPSGTREQEIDRIAASVIRRSTDHATQQIRKVINATGVVLHTGLGRAPLSNAAIDAVVDSACGTNVELDLVDGQRRYRGSQIIEKLQILTGCEDALIVNNNAAATLLALQVVRSAKRTERPEPVAAPQPDERKVTADDPREVIISRGQLIEIGGSFRLPEIFELSGAAMREVGTTNRTHLADYQRAIGPQTAAIIRVHPSNFRILGFTNTPDILSLVRLAGPHGVPVIDDIGSGCLTNIDAYGLPPEPTFGESIAAGADIVLGSGDKLLGGPQCGIVIGRIEWISRMRQHPLARALRVDKLTLAALSATLDAYLDNVADTVPVHQLLATPVQTLRHRAEDIVRQLASAEEWRVEIAEDVAEVGGGSLPGTTLPTVVIRLKSTSQTADAVCNVLRGSAPGVVPRIKHDAVVIDLRSVLKNELPLLLSVLQNLAGKQKHA